MKEKLGENVKNLTSIYMFALNWVKDCVKINRPTDASTLMAAKMFELLKKATAQVCMLHCYNCVCKTCFVM